MSSGDRAGPFSRSRLTSKSLKLSVIYIDVLILEMGLARVPEISVFPTRISVSGQENVAILTLQPGYLDETGMNISNEFCVVLLYMLCFPHHRHPI